MRSPDNLIRGVTDYRVIGELGRGAEGVVIHAVQISTEETNNDVDLSDIIGPTDERVVSEVAVKCISKKHIALTDVLRDHTKGLVPREAYVLSRLKHRNIVHLVDHFADDDFFYIVMQHPGPNSCDLFDYINEHPDLPEDRIRNIFRQVLEAVAYMHDNDYVHRDIKDENVIIDGQGRAYLIDFGASSQIPKCSMEYFSDVRGTEHVLSPEEWEGKPHRGVEQDVWSLGVLLYTMSSGGFTHKKSEHHVIKAAIDQFFSKRSVHLRDLLGKMLEPNVALRIGIDQIQRHAWLTNSREMTVRNRCFVDGTTVPNLPIHSETAK